MQVRSLLLFSLGCYGLLLAVARGQKITKPPESTTAALGTNATFSCCGDGRVLWQINGTQIRDNSQVPAFATIQVFAPLPEASSNELIVTATRVTNATLMIVCVMDPLSGPGAPVESDPVQLLVYAEPNPPINLMINVDGLDLIATWNEPFTLEGEELTYVVSIMNRGITEDEITVNTTRFILSEPTGERDCSEYMFTVFSRNGFSKSNNAITGRANIPTEPLQMRSSDVNIQVSLTSGVSATIQFNPRDPCPSYPVMSYNFTITEQDTDRLVTSIPHTGNISLVVDGSKGLIANQVYLLTIEAENRIGSTLSDDILLYTTGLQSLVATMELNGSITVTCTFATGATSTGCQVTIFMRDNLEEVFFGNITHPNGVSLVTKNMVVSGLSENIVLIVKAVELLSEGGVGDALFQSMVVVASLPTSPTPTMVPTTPSVQGTPTPFGSMFYFIIGAVGGAIVILLLLIILSICVILSLRSRRSKRNRYFTSSEELKDNYSYGSAAILAENGGGIHARSNTYDYRDEQQVAPPLYETIPNKKIHMGNGASAQPVPNPVYAGEVVHSGSKTAANPVYAEANGEQCHRATLLSQTSHTTDVSALNPVYSGSVVPISPLSISGSFSQINQPTQLVIPQPSLGASGPRYEMKLTSSSQYATPNEVANSRYASGPGNSEPSPYVIPKDSPTLPPKGGGAIGGAMVEGEGLHYTNTPGNPIPTNPETGYSTLSRENIVEPPPGPVPIYETIKVKDTRPPVRPDGDGVTLQTNKSYGLLMTDSQSTGIPTGNQEATPTTTTDKHSPPGSPRSTSGSNPPPPPLSSHSPPPNEEPPPPCSPTHNQSQTS